MAARAERNRSEEKKAAVKKKEDEKRAQILQRLREEREALLQEAGILSRSLYRICLRSLKIIRPGNEHDEAEFKQREKQQLEEMLKPGVNFSTMAPPVDRENELRSRFDYYFAFCQEGFEQDSFLLKRNPWLETDIQAFFLALYGGEEKRQYILKDYKFNDKYEGQFEMERAKQLEQRVIQHVKEVYQVKEWRHSSEIKPEDYEMDDDDDDEDSWDDDDDFPR